MNDPELTNVKPLTTWILKRNTISFGKKKHTQKKRSKIYLRNSVVKYPNPFKYRWSNFQKQYSQEINIVNKSHLKWSLVSYNEPLRVTAAQIFIVQYLLSNIHKSRFSFRQFFFIAKACIDQAPALHCIVKSSRGKIVEEKKSVEIK